MVEESRAYVTWFVSSEEKDGMKEARKVRYRQHATCNNPQVIPYVRLAFAVRLFHYSTLPSFQYSFFC